MANLPLICRIYFNSITMLLCPVIAGAITPGPVTADCSLSSLTKDCQIFQDKDFVNGVSFPDGTFIANPVKENQNFSELESKLKAQAKALNAMSSVRSKPFSASFQLAIIKAIEDSPKVLDALTDVSNSNGILSLTVPWPADDETAGVSRVPIEKLRESIQRMPPDKLQELRAAFANSKTELQMARDTSPNQISGEALSGRRKRVQEIFEKSRELFVGEILQGRNPTSLPSEERSLFERVSRTRLQPLDGVASKPECQTNSSDALYTTENNIVMCPGLWNLPDSSLVEIFAHEIAHSVGPCVLQFPLATLNAQQLLTLPSDPSSLPDKIRSNPDFKATVLYLVGQAKSGVRELNLQELMYSADPAAVLGLLKQENFVEIVAEGVKFEKHAGRKAYSCLEQHVGVRLQTTSEAKALTRDYLRSVQASRALSARERVHLAETAKHVLTRFPQCVTSSRKSQLSEANSDAWSSRILGRWLTANKPTTPVEQLSPVASMLPSYCRDLQRSRKPQTTFIDQIHAGASLSALKAHPFAATRTDMILLADVNVQKALGCKPIQTRSCADELLPRRTSSIPSESSGQSRRPIK